MKHLGLVFAGLLLAAVSALVVPGQGLSATSEKRRDAAALAKYSDVMANERQALVKTQGLLADKLETREGEMKRRLRAIYKLSRANWPRLWFEPEARRESARWLGAARRVAMRDIREVEMLHHEIELANRADIRLVEEAKLQPAAAPKAKSLQWPLEDSKIVQDFGELKGPSHRVVLRSRGVRLESSRGQPVNAVAAGRIRYSGPIRGLGNALIIDHGELISVVGNLNAIGVSVGDAVTRNTVLAKADGDTLYLELRLAVGQRGQSVNPAPLLMTPR